MKAFGESQGLKATDNYGRYSDLNRGAAVWVVQACQELEFKPKRWSFPIAGTVPYLGWFDENPATMYAVAPDGHNPETTRVRASWRANKGALDVFLSAYDRHKLASVTRPSGRVLNIRSRSHERRRRTRCRSHRRQSQHHRARRNLHSRCQIRG